MGQTFCMSRNNQKKQLLTEEEIDRLRMLFDKLKSRYEDTYKNNFLSEDCFTILYDQKPEISSKIYKYMLENGDPQEPLKFQKFTQSVGQLTKSDPNFRVTRTQQYTAISVQRIKLDQLNYEREKISYLEALDLFLEIEFFLNQWGYYVTDYGEPDESTARSILQRIFRSSTGSIMFYELTSALESMFPSLTNFLSRYFYSVFFQQIKADQPPKFSKPSYLMNNSQFEYISISSSLLLEADNYELLWTSGQHGFNFDLLYKSLILYKGPTLLLLKFIEYDPDEELDSKGKTMQKYSVMGALNAQKWIETNSYQGSSQNMLFQIYPQFCSFPVGQGDIFRSRKYSNNYSYLNRSDQKKGIGFGGDMKQFRLWIDAQNIQQGSYVLDKGDPYQDGYLIDRNITTAQISYIEAWGVGQLVQSIQSSEEEIKVYRASTNDLLTKYQ